MGVDGEQAGAAWPAGALPAERPLPATPWVAWWVVAALLTFAPFVAYALSDVSENVRALATVGAMAGILASIANSGASDPVKKADTCAVWTEFAARGVGDGADGVVVRSRGSSTAQITESYAVPAGAC